MNKIWFVTGSSRGLGRALVEEILAAGDKVVATARKPEELADLAKVHGDKIRTVKLDVTSAGDAERAVTETIGAFGRIDVVVNNAAMVSRARLKSRRPTNSRGRSTPTFGAWLT